MKQSILKYISIIALAVGIVASIQTCGQTEYDDSDAYAPAHTPNSTARNISIVSFTVAAITYYFYETNKHK